MQKNLKIQVDLIEQRMIIIENHGLGFSKTNILEKSLPTKLENIKINEKSNTSITSFKRIQKIFKLFKFKKYYQFSQTNNKPIRE